MTSIQNNIEDTFNSLLHSEMLGLIGDNIYEDSSDLDLTYDGIVVFVAGVPRDIYLSIMENIILES